MIGSGIFSTSGFLLADLGSPLIVLRRREGTALHVPGFPFIPLAFLMGVAAIAVFTVMKRPMESLVGFGTIVAGLVACYLSHSALAAGNAEGGKP
jgi:hypothetical protein